MSTAGPPEHGPDQGSPVPYEQQGGMAYPPPEQAPGPQPQGGAYPGPPQGGYGGYQVPPQGGYGGYQVPPQGGYGYPAQPTGGYVPPAYGQPMMPRKEPVLSLIVSFFLPGVGTMINGEVGKGVGILVGYLVGVLFSFFLIGVPFAIGFWVWGMVDGYTGAVRYNQLHGYPG